MNVLIADWPIEFVMSRHSAVSSQQSQISE